MDSSYSSHGSGLYREGFPINVSPNASLVEEESPAADENSIDIESVAVDPSNANIVYAGHPGVREIRSPQRTGFGKAAPGLSYSNDLRRRHDRQRGANVIYMFTDEEARRTES